MIRLAKPALMMVLAVSLPLWAQRPCDLFDDPTYCDDNLGQSLPLWNERGSGPDLNGNGQVDVLDFMMQLERSSSAFSHGLLGRYWGFADGSEDQSIDFPNFAAMPYDPTIVMPIPQIDDAEGFDNQFLNTTMRRNFGASFDGWLYVPETANYSITISGSRGARLIVNNLIVAEFEGSPPQATYAAVLQEGMLPIRIEYFNNDRGAELTLAWESNGSQIGPGLKTIAARYLYHSGTSVTENQIADLDILFDPPSGTRLTTRQLDLTAFMVNADPDVTLEVNDQVQQLVNDTWYPSIALDPGLNRFDFKLSDSGGRTFEKSYYVYSDTDPDIQNGTYAALYSSEHYDDVMPDPYQLGLMPWAVAAPNSTQILRNGNDDLFYGNAFVSRGSIVDITALIEIPTTGWYRFRISDTGALRINGEFIAGIWYQYPDQWINRGSVYLEAGKHHWWVRTAEAWNSPQLRLYWQYGGQNQDWEDEVQIPDNIFTRAVSDRPAVPNPTPIRIGHNRVSDTLVAEYLFRANDPYADTSGYGHHLTPDPRIYVRNPGGITLQTGTSLFSQQAGVHSVYQIRNAEAFTLEADVTYDREVDGWDNYELISITDGAWNYLARLRLRNDRIRLTINNRNGTERNYEVDDVITGPGRYHIMATMSLASVRIYVNGVEVLATATNIDSLIMWPSLAQVNVGPRYSRHEGLGTSDRSLPGSILVAAVYAAQMSPSGVTHNRNHNLALNPSPGPLPAPPVTQFPPPGTTAGQLAEAHHVLNRMTFGPTPDSLANILSVGVDTWINQQMSPDAIDDSHLSNVLNSDFYMPWNNKQDLRSHMFMRMVHSERQFLEVMTQFWDNHFNTLLDKTDHITEELAENARFREHALGNFSDLLVDSAMHFPMTVYLDNDTNVVGAPNENYAREIMELHTMGVNNGYTHDDIIEASRVFTGWTARRGKFYFDPGLHDYGEKTLFAGTSYELVIPAGGGLSDGLTFIDHLTSLSQTAEFITWKMCQLLISDDPPADVWNAAQTTFENTSGDIAATLNTILSHARFRTDLAYRGNKTKTPLEFLASLCRMTEAFPMTRPMVGVLEDMGMELLEFADPTGFSEEGVDWMDTNSMLQRLNFANALATNRGYGGSPQVDLKHLLESHGVETADEILDFFSAITTHGRENAGVRDIAMNWLTDGSPGSFVLTDETLDNQVRQVLSIYLRLPELSKQ
ncbi:DUF1800 domain-containing protein [Sulfidibacter corallicola]|uniref:DUF1800 family protein n=1 Tax=Sulfidibacter corallicola TaxID=2818388 RepID=A0A8A4TQB0_SULCO|nr:DUF1800 family protein [Sulfidibacter corallicola]QTD51272.1 DUF1800 family protein [Sulfidibacter corallicola]